MPIASNTGASLIGLTNTVTVWESVYSPSVTDTNILILPAKFSSGIRVNKLLKYAVFQSKTWNIISNYNFGP